MSKFFSNVIENKTIWSNVWKPNNLKTYSPFYFPLLVVQGTKIQERQRDQACYLCLFILKPQPDKSFTKHYYFGRAQFLNVLHIFGKPFIIFFYLIFYLISRGPHHFYSLKMHKLVRHVILTI